MILSQFWQISFEGPKKAKKNLVILSQLWRNFTFQGPKKPDKRPFKKSKNAKRLNIPKLKNVETGVGL